MQEIIDFIKSAIAYITNWIADMVDSAVAQIVNLYNYLKTFLTAFLNDLKAQVSAIITVITNAMNQLMVQLKTALQTIVDWIWALVNPIVNTITAYTQEAIRAVKTVMLDAFNVIVNFAVNAFNALSDSVESIARPIIEFVTLAKEKVIEWLGAALDTLKPAVEEYTKLVKAGIDAFTKEAGEFVSAVNIKLTDISTAFQKASDQLAETLRQLGPEMTKPITEILDQLVKPFLGLTDEKDQAEIYSALNNAFSPNSLDLTNRAQAQNFFNQIMPTSLIGRFVFMAILSPFLVKDVYSGVVNANAQVVLQEFATKYHYQLLSPADATQAVYRGDMTRLEAREAIIRQGYSPEDADRLINNGENVPNAGELMAMRLRETITDEDYSKAMIKQGFDQKYEKAFRDLGEIIPPVSDLITMAVKGAFSQEETVAFRTDEDFPQDILPFLKKQGLNEDWARKYWRAHWNLPSPGQGFEMFQRGIFGETKLKTLLKALDISPGWRDDLIQLSYNVLGRIDVRRLHQLGMMSHDDLVNAHKAMGYSPEDAEKLSLFTEQLNKGKPGEADEQLGRLSRTNVINFYQDGTIDRARAIDLLVRIGYTNDAATLFIDTADFDAERVQRQAEIDFIIASASAGVLDFGAAQDEFSKLHLSPTELNKATAKLMREQTKATKLPTVEQGTKMFTSGAISEATFKDLLRRLGYRAEWQDAFIHLAKGDIKTEKGKAK